MTYRKGLNKEEIDFYNERIKYLARPRTKKEYLIGYDEKIEQLRQNQYDDDDNNHLLAIAQEWIVAERVVGRPLHSVISYIRGIVRLKEPWDSIDTKSGNFPLLTINQLFDCLSLVCDENKGMVFFQLDSVDYDIRQRAISALKKNQKWLFHRLVKKHFSPSDTVLLSNICWNQKIAETLYIGYTLGGRYYYLEKKSKHKSFEENEITLSDIREQIIYTSSEYYNNRSFYESPRFKRFFSEQDRHVIDGILTRPEGECLLIEYNGLIETIEAHRSQEQKEKMQTQSSEVCPQMIPLGDSEINAIENEAHHHNIGSFTLPNDLFEPGSGYPIDSKNKNAHFKTKDEIEKKGGELFAKLIKTIASYGYIAPSNRTLFLLTYILTGRCKPQDYQAGEKLEWQDTGYGYELLYIIKYIIGNEKGKFKKVRNLFSGPKWLGKGEIRYQPDYAKAGFRKALNALYPDECKVKGHVEKVPDQVKHTEWDYIPENTNKDR